MAVMIPRLQDRRAQVGRIRTIHRAIAISHWRWNQRPNILPHWVPHHARPRDVASRPIRIAYVGEDLRRVHPLLKWDLLIRKFARKLRQTCWREVEYLAQHGFVWKEGTGQKYTVPAELLKTKYSDTGNDEYMALHRILKAAQMDTESEI